MRRHLHRRPRLSCCSAPARLCRNGRGKGLPGQGDRRPVDARPRRAGSRNAVVHRCRQAVRRHGHQGRLGDASTTHEYESKVLAPAFTAITGIKVTHDLIQEGDVVEKMQTQMQTGQNLYDGWVNDSDLIGTHWRYQQVRNLTDWMADEGKDVTNPNLDLEGLHRHVLHHRAGQEALPAARPAVREPLLVPLRLVQRREEQGRLQGQVRLRPRRAGQLVGL